jgi:prepilin-type N-terminal cleavage/methylation domain-containing protein/prepilin-type processing-associated H-X9-DG protein
MNTLPYPLKSNKKGFTLIELLVVIAIISTLASILFPVFARAREQARKAACQSNLKQLGLAVAQYTQDYDETYPLGRFGYSTPTSSFAYWYVVLEPYVKNRQIFVCPTAGQIGTNNRGYGWNTRGTGTSQANVNGFGYWLSDPPSASNWGTPSGEGPLKLSQVTNAASTIQIADPASNNWATNGYYVGSYINASGLSYMPVLHGGQVGPFGGSTGDVLVAVAPGGGGNYLFADGHVKFMQASQTFCSNLWNVDKERGLNSGTQGCGTLKP